MVAKGRHQHGDTHHLAKLDEERVRSMLRLHANGMSMRALGRQFGVSHKTVSMVIHRETWRHVQA